MKRILIVFTDIHLAYSPTTLNFFYLFKKQGFDVEIIAAAPKEWYSTKRVEDESIKYLQDKDIKFSRIIYEKIYGFLERKMSPSKGDLKQQFDLTLYLRAKSFVKAIRKSKWDFIIAADLLALWCTQQAGFSAHLLSLELADIHKYKGIVDFSKLTA